MEQQLGFWLDEDETQTVMKDLKNANCVILLQLYMRTYEWRYVEALINSIPKLPIYRREVKTHFSSLIMTAIFHEQTIKYVYDFYTSLNFNKNELILEKEVIISLCRHIFLFPNNKEIIIELIKNQDLKNVVNYDSILYFIDEPFFIKKHFGFLEKEKLNNIAHTINLGSLKIMNELINVYGMSKNSIIKMSLPIFLENIKNYDITDYFFMKDLVAEIAVYSKTLWIPFIFENYIAKNLFTNQEWITLQNGMYGNYYTLPFVQTLIYYMEKYNIPLSKIFVFNKKPLNTSQSVIEYLRSKNITDLNFKVENVINVKSLYEITNLFECCRCKNFGPIFYHIYSNLCHKNKRFITELNYPENLDLGWSDEVKIQYKLFKRFSQSYIDQINIIDKIIIEYNSFLAFRYNINDFLGLRILTKINNLCKKITLKNLQAMHKQLFENICIAYTVYLTGIKEKLLPQEEFLQYKNQSWILPENATLTEHFLDLYLYSELRETEYNVKISRMITYFLNKDNHFVPAKLVEKSVKHFIDIDKITDILVKFGYIDF